MNQKGLMLNVVRQSLYPIYVFLFIVTLFSTGCTSKESKEKTPEARAIECEILDKLPEDIAKPLEVNYGKKLVYLGTTIEKLTKNQFKISYYWQLKNDLGEYKKVFVHFTDSKSNILFQNDHEFCAKRSFEELKGKFVKDTYLVGVPESAKGKEINVRVGIYAPEGPSLKIESSGKTLVDADNKRALVETINP